MKFIFFFPEPTWTQRHAGTHLTRTQLCRIEILADTAKNEQDLNNQVLLQAPSTEYKEE